MQAISNYCPHGSGVQLQLLIWSSPSYCEHKLSDRCDCGLRVNIPIEYSIEPGSAKEANDHWQCMFSWSYKYRNSKLRNGQVVLLVEHLSSNESASKSLCHRLIVQRNRKMSSPSSSSSSFLVPDKICLKFYTFDECTIIDRKWNGFITRIVNLRMATCEILAIFSTLGGAFSCLGESGDLSAAQTAGCIAFRQLILSRRIEDPNLIIRCYIYQVYSLCQLRLKKKAVKLLKQIIYPTLQVLVSQNKVEPCIKKMYIAACHKVKQMKASPSTI